MSEFGEMRHYFVDEAGDLTLFDRRGRTIIGVDGVSNVFMVGVAQIPNPEVAAKELNQLRASLLADPYFRGVPSMQPSARKTAICFHAKDDVGEVRREVFRILPRLGAKVQVAIRRKAAMAESARIAWRTFGKKLSANDVYDDLVKRLFKNLLHQGNANRITIARRGKSDRQDALESAIEKAKANFVKQCGKPSDRPTQVIPASPSEAVGLQVVDYYLWALQRMYERQEDRFFQLVADRFRLIMDLDDTRRKDYGEWYSDNNPLKLEKIRPVAG